jgi:hypothetical protein
VIFIHCDIVCMSRKKVTTIKENEVMILPKDNINLERFIKENKTSLTEQTLSSIEFAIENNLQTVQVFRFDNSDFVITLSEKQFLENVNHIYDTYLESENYELCSRVVKLKNVLKTLNHYNEKKVKNARSNGDIK